MSVAAGVPVDELAARLDEARETGRTIPQLIHEYPDLDLATAYEIQRAGLELRRAAGHGAPVGYKVGVGSHARQRNTGASEPIRGTILASMAHSEDAPLSLSGLIHPRLEAEIAFLIGERIEGKGATVPAVLAATAGVVPAFEIVDSRYDDARFTPVDAIADNCSAARFVFGGPLVAAEGIDLQLEGVIVRADGEIVATAAGGAAGGQPAAAVAWLARSVGALEPGTIVMTGGLNPHVPLDDLRSVVAQYTRIGSVSLTIR